MANSQTKVVPDIAASTETINHTPDNEEEDNKEDKEEDDKEEDEYEDDNISVADMLSS